MTRERTSRQQISTASNLPLGGRATRKESCGWPPREDLTYTRQLALQAIAVQHGGMVATNGSADMHRVSAASINIMVDTS